LAKAAQEDFEVHQIDIKTAVLHGILEEEVYVTQPPGFENVDTRVVCKLVKALYGLKPAPRAWPKKLSEALAKLDFLPC
jgi:Reverse transcriptase (RNA-dependent DNA polymerase)